MIKQMKEKGCYLEEIAAEVGVSQKTISRALKRSGAPGKRKSGVRASKLDPYKAEIDRLLSEQVWNGVVILSCLRDLGYEGGASIVRDDIRPKRALRRPQATVRFETQAGEQLQHDGGELWVWLGGRDRKIHIAVNTLGYSRRFHVYGAPRHDAEHTYESLVQAFEYFDGVPLEVWVDSQKAAVIEHRRGEYAKFNPASWRWRVTTGFGPRRVGRRGHRPRVRPSAWWAT